MKRNILGGFLFSVGLFAGCLAGSGGGDGGPRLCVPDAEVEPAPSEGNPECEACVSRSCALESDCDDPCESYYACTCECDGDDQACFAACGDERTPSCEQCTDASSEALVSCVQSECADACLGGVGVGDDGGAGDGGAGDDGGWSDDGGFDDDEGGDDDGGWSDDGGGDGSNDGSAACEELHGSCCPNLDGVDRDLCESATDETGCQIWLDIFRDEGAC
jgi:hypothetical protein